MCVACSINLVCTFECTRKKEKNRNQCFVMVRSIYCISTCDWYRRVVNMEDFNACISICRQDLFFRILLNGKHLMYHLSMSVKEECCLDEIGWRGDIATIGVVNVPFLTESNDFSKPKKCFASQKTTEYILESSEEDVTMVWAASEIGWMSWCLRKVDGPQQQK